MAQFSRVTGVAAAVAIYAVTGGFVAFALGGPKPQTSEMRPSLASEVRNVSGALAFVDGEPILRSDVIALATSKNLELSQEDIDRGIDVVNELVEELIQLQLFKAEAMRRRLHRREAVQSAMTIAGDDVLKDRVLREVVEERVDEEALLDLYKDDAKRLRLSEEVKASHILVPTLEQADFLSVRLKAGVDFEELARQFSIDPATATQGGSLGYFSRDEMDKKFADVAFSLPAGAISEPFNTRFGWHIVKLEDRRMLESPTYEELRPKIIRYKTFEVIEELINRLREKATIKYVNKTPRDAGGDATSDGGLGAGTDVN